MSLLGNYETASVYYQEQVTLGRASIAGRAHNELLSVSYITVHMYCICLSAWFMFAYKQMPYRFAVHTTLLAIHVSDSRILQGVVQQIHRLLGSIDDPVRKMKWQQIQER